MGNKSWVTEQIRFYDPIVAQASVISHALCKIYSCRIEWRGGGGNVSLKWAPCMLLSSLRGFTASPCAKRCDQNRMLSVIDTDKRYSTSLVQGWWQKHMGKEAGFPRELSGRSVVGGFDAGQGLVWALSPTEEWALEMPLLLVVNLITIFTVSSVSKMMCRIFSSFLPGKMSHSC